MALKIVLLAGDGTGPELMREAVKVIKAVESHFGLSFDLVPYPCGGQYYLETGQEWPDGAVDSWKGAGAHLLGAGGGPGRSASRSCGKTRRVCIPPLGASSPVAGRTSSRSTAA